MGHERLQRQLLKSQLKIRVDQGYDLKCNQKKWNVKRHQEAQVEEYGEQSFNQRHRTIIVVSNGLKMIQNDDDMHTSFQKKCLCTHFQVHVYASIARSVQFHHFLYAPVSRSMYIYQFIGQCISTRLQVKIYVPVCKPVCIRLQVSVHT